MQCDICKKNRATLHLKNNINGIITERDLCSECYNNIISSNYIGVFGKAFGSLSGMTAPSKTAKCSLCGTKLSSILETFFVGCPNCYREFGAYILPSVKSLQNAVVHEGKRPLSAKESVSDEYERLRNELDRAISKENYEQAAIISARLKQLRSECVQGDGCDE